MYSAVVRLSFGEIMKGTEKKENDPQKTREAGDVVSVCKGSDVERVEPSV